jgi:hypothetical protein
MYFIETLIGNFNLQLFNWILLSASKLSKSLVKFYRTLILGKPTKFTTETFFHIVLGGIHLTHINSHRIEIVLMTL